MADEPNQDWQDRLFAECTISIEALFGEGSMDPTEEGQQAVAWADLIMGRDIDTGEHVLLYGQDILERVMQTQEAEWSRSLRIDLDLDTGDLERVLLYILVIKDVHDYPGQDRTRLVEGDYSGSIVWHYTVVSRLLGGILEHDLLRAAVAHGEPDERPAVWFSTNPMWDASANRTIPDPDTGQPRMLTWAEMQHYGPVRIGVRSEDAPVSWSAHKQGGGISRELARRTENSGEGESHQWSCTYADVPRAKWVALEIHDGRSGRWEPLTVGRLEQLETLKGIEQAPADAAADPPGGP